MLKSVVYSCNSTTHTVHIYAHRRQRYSLSSAGFITQPWWYHRSQLSQAIHCESSLSSDPQWWQRSWRVSDSWRRVVAISSLIWFRALLVVAKVRAFPSNIHSANFKAKAPHDVLSVCRPCGRVLHAHLDTLHPLFRMNALVVSRHLFVFSWDSPIGSSNRHFFSWG